MKDKPLNEISVLPISGTTGTSGERPEQLAVNLRDVSFTYDGGTTWALERVNLSITTGTRICLVGPNGSGKSTLSKIIAGLVAPDEGEVTLLGTNVFDADGPHPQHYRHARHDIGAVFQNPEDQIVTTVVQDDVVFGPENLGLERHVIGQRLDGALSAVDMNEYRDADPTHMSGGQQQRIAIAGTLAMNPNMIVLDEPTAMLDSAAQHEVMDILDAMQTRGTTIVHVTHRPEETARADRVIRLEQGHIVDDMVRNPLFEHGDTTDYDGRTRHDSQQPQSWPTATTLNGENGEHTGEIVSAIPADRIESNLHVDGETDALRNETNAIRGDDWIAHAPQPAIEVDHVSMRYSNAQSDALHDLSLTANSGETLAIMGRNGAGKTTLARLLSALERPTHGNITIAGIDLSTRSRSQRKALRNQVGLVMQRPERQLFADTVAQDIAYGPKNQGLSSIDVATRVSDALRILHIEHLASRSPFSLSGGQQRLAAIAGVLACRPNILIMDEPTASLDAVASNRIYDLIRELKRRGVTIVMITHSIQEARNLADRIITLPSGIAKPLSVVENKTRGATKPISFVAGLDPRITMVTFLALMFTAFLIHHPLQLALTAIMVAVIIGAAKLNPLRLLASVHAFLALFVIMGLLNIFFVRTGTVLATLLTIPITTDGVTTALLYACRFALVIILGAVLLATTTPTALTDGFASLLSPLSRCIHTQEIALVMSLALRFLPTLGSETRGIMDAQAARGGSIETGSPIKRVKAMTSIIIPVFAGTLRHADNLSLALDARCYEEGAHRTHWRELHITTQDICFAVLTVAYIIALVALGYMA
jgi:energy-coupling factor transport system ATP-binding protein